MADILQTIWPNFRQSTHLFLKQNFIGIGFFMYNWEGGKIGPDDLVPNKWQTIL